MRARARAKVGVAGENFRRALTCENFKPYHFHFPSAVPAKDNPAYINVSYITLLLTKSKIYSESLKLKAHVIILMYLHSLIVSIVG